MPLRGDTLMAELGCIQCHSDLSGRSLIRDQAPDLSHAGLRYRTAYLFEFLRAPRPVRRHIGRARMPDFHLDEKEALALALFLEAQRRMPTGWPDVPEELREQPGRAPSPFSKADFDRELGAGLACLTCHTLNGTGGTLAPELSDVGHQLQPAWMKAYLVSPARFGVPSTVMPAQFFQLSADGKRYQPILPDAARKIKTLVDYLAGASAPRAAGLEAKLDEARKNHPDITGAAGEQLFRSLNCAACHRLDPITPRENAAPALASEGLRVQPAWLSAYLKKPAPLRRAGFQPGDGSRMPDFHLRDDEAVALTSHLASQRTPLPGLGTNSAGAPPSAFARSKAQRLLDGKLSCLGCHRLGDKGGVIGPDLAGVKARLQPAYVHGIIRNPRRIAPHSVMPQVPLPDETADLIARHLLHGDWPAPAAPAPYVSPAETKMIPSLAMSTSAGPPVRARYLRHCAACHGVDGRGDGFNAPFLEPARPTPFADRDRLAPRPDDTLFDGIHSGGAILNRSHLMPPWGGTFEPAEIRELVGHLRELCRCEGPAWSRDGVGRAAANSK